MRESRLPRPLLMGLAWLAPTVAVVLSPVYALLLAGSGTTPQRLIGWAVNVLLFLVFPLVGGLIATRRPQHPIGWLMSAGSALILVGFTARAYAMWVFGSGSGVVPAGVALGWLAPLLVEAGLAVLPFLVLLFPDGRLPGPRWRPVAWLAVGGAGLWVLATATLPGPLPGDDGPLPADNPFGVAAAADALHLLAGVGAALVLVAALAAAASVVLRLRRARGETRRQLRLIACAGAMMIVLIAINTLLGYNSVVAVASPDPALELLSFVMWGLTFAALPVAIGLAILRYRLWDIEVLINRVVVFGLLTGIVVILYVVVVGYLSVVFQERGNLLISLVATGVVAVLFQPLRERLQRGVNQLMYGDRDDPYRVLARLGERLEGTLAPGAVLPTIVQTVTEAMKLPYAAVAIRGGNGSSMAAAAGVPGGELVRLPLIYQQETVGELELAPRAPGETFGQADQRLLRAFARQAGVAAQAVRLNADLQHARERLVNAREEERRRLRRDLHDGLGPQLAGVTFRLHAARHVLRRDPAAAEAALDELMVRTQSAVDDVRRLVYALRPPALDDLGLVGALRELAPAVLPAGLEVVIEAPEPVTPLPAAVEAATYRIAQAALANVARHAEADTCWIRLRLADGLELEVADDGRGLSSTAPAGVGLVAMRERALELGGTCTLEPRPCGGSRVRAWLPISEPATPESPG
jgi:signal transduction histidine kinase